MTDYYDLGSHSRSITTTSPEAQRWFDRGLIWTYGFNHGEALRCFKRAIRADPSCAMAYWGVAYAGGPH
ncbi:MAG: tetratricopeptide repeat protein [Thermomicrobiales bacterium]|nr:tetratricopeptide repeat protein [Thermomicrobiales bacterium]